PTPHQKSHTRLFDSGNGKAETFAFPSGSKKQYLDFVRSDFQLRSRSGALEGRRAELRDAHSVRNQINGIGGKPVVADDLIADHRRVGNHASRLTLAKQCFFQPQNILVLPIKSPGNLLQFCFELRFTIKPGLVNAITSAENITVPDSFQADYQIAMLSGITSFEFIREGDRAIGGNAYGSAKGP